MQTRGPGTGHGQGGGLWAGHEPTKSWGKRAAQLMRLGNDCPVPTGEVPEVAHMR